MLRALRNKSQSFLFKIFLVLIVIGFAAWGVGDLTGNKIPPVFKSNDFEISYEQIINDFNKSRDPFNPSSVTTSKLSALV